MKKIVLALTVLLLAVGSCFAQSDLQALNVVKYTKSESITVKQLKARCETYEKQIGKKLSLEERKLVLRSLTEEKLVLQAAAKAGISIPDSTADQYFIQTMSQQIGANVTEKELDDMLKKQQGISLDQLLIQQTGMNTAEYKTYIKNQLIAQQYVISQRQAELQKVAPTDAEIRTFYESNKTSFIWNDMVKLFVVIVPKGTNADNARNKVNQIRNNFTDKKMTVEQIGIQSQNPDSGYNAGEVLLPKTEAGAATIGLTFDSLLYIFTQNEGFVSDVTETNENFIFLSVSKKYDAKMLSISDIVTPDTTVTVYEYIRQNLAQQKQMVYIQQAAQELSEELYKPEYVEEKKTGAALDKLLNWGE